MTPMSPLRPKIEPPQMAPPEGQKSPVKGLPAEDAPSIVISSLASLDNDHDFNYLKKYSSDSNGKPMTAKDRARHGMLRTMLRKSLEVTRPNWPKHPNMRSTDRLLDEERGMLKQERTLKSQGTLGLDIHAESLQDLQALMRKPVMSMSPEFKKIYHLNGTTSPDQMSPTNWGNNSNQISPGMRMKDRTIGTFGLGVEGHGGSSIVRTMSDADLRKQFYGSSKRLPSPSARNLELLREKEFKTSLKIYARPATTNFKFLGCVWRPSAARMCKRTENRRRAQKSRVTRGRESSLYHVSLTNTARFAHCFFRETSRTGSKGLYGGSKTNTVKIHRGIRISKQP